VRYLMEREWALTADDVLWRRTKRGLRFSREEAAGLDAYMKSADGKSHSAAAE
jgi:glycerol-3-phosphate dehydrogenase